MVVKRRKLRISANAHFAKFIVSKSTYITAYLNTLIAYLCATSSILGKAAKYIYIIYILLKI